MHLDYVQLCGSEIDDYFEDIARLRITVFREYPYLYDGDLEYEKKYLQVYSKSKNSLVIIVKDNDQVIGATTCIPLADESAEFQKAFLEKGIDIQRVFYFGESIILPEYRGNKIGHKFFEMREAHAKSKLTDLACTAFCAVSRPKDHPKRPKNYRPLNAFWQRMGYKQQADMQVFYPWKDLGEPCESQKTLIFWLKTHS